MSAKRASYIKKIVQAITVLGIIAVLILTGRFVVLAYTQERTAPEVRLTGINLESKFTELEKSPFITDDPIDTRRQPVSLAFVNNPKELSEEVPIEGGTSEFFGVVTGTIKTQQINTNPEGENSITEKIETGKPIAGATVIFERHTNKGVGTIKVQTNQLGEYEVKGLLGGRYLVRSYLPGVSTSGDPHVTFIPEISKNPAEAKKLNEAKVEGFKGELNFNLNSISDNFELQPVISDPIYTTLSGTVAIVLTKDTIDEEGRLVKRAVTGGNITLTPNAGTVIETQTATTNSRGFSVYKVTCQTNGVHTAIAQFQDQEIPVTLPRCIPIPPPEPEPDKEPEPEDQTEIQTQENSPSPEANSSQEVEQ